MTFPKRFLTLAGLLSSHPSWVWVRVVSRGRESPLLPHARRRAWTTSETQALSSRPPYPLTCSHVEIARAANATLSMVKPDADLASTKKSFLNDEHADDMHEAGSSESFVGLVAGATVAVAGVAAVATSSVDTMSDADVERNANGSAAELRVERPVLGGKHRDSLREQLVQARKRLAAVQATPSRTSSVSPAEVMEQEGLGICPARDGLLLDDGIPSGRPELSGLQTYSRERHALLPEENQALPSRPLVSDLPEECQALSLRPPVENLPEECQALLSRQSAACGVDVKRGAPRCSAESHECKLDKEHGCSSCYRSCHTTCESPLCAYDPCEICCSVSLITHKNSEHCMDIQKLNLGCHACFRVGCYSASPCCLAKCTPWPNVRHVCVSVASGTGGCANCGHLCHASNADPLCPFYRRCAGQLDWEASAQDHLDTQAGTGGSLPHRSQLTWNWRGDNIVVVDGDAYAVGYGNPGGFNDCLIDSLRQCLGLDTDPRRVRNDLLSSFASSPDARARVTPNSYLDLDSHWRILISAPAQACAPNPFREGLIPSSESGPTATEHTDSNPKIGRKLAYASLILIFKIFFQNGIYSKKVWGGNPLGGNPFLRFFFLPPE